LDPDPNPDDPDPDPNPDPDPDPNPGLSDGLYLGAIRIHDLPPPRLIYKYMFIYLERFITRPNIIIS
jgi:hypothetical protein